MDVGHYIKCKRFQSLSNVELTPLYYCTLTHTYMHSSNKPLHSACVKKWMKKIIRGILESNALALVFMDYELALEWISFESQKPNENTFLWTNVSLYNSKNLLSTLVY